MRDWYIPTLPTSILLGSPEKEQARQGMRGALLFRLCNDCIITTTALQNSTCIPSRFIGLFR
jgi:hypothetical protein